MSKSTPKTFLTNESYMNDYSEEIKAEVNNQYVDAFRRASQSSIENLVKRGRKWSHSRT